MSVRRGYAPLLILALMLTPTGFAAFAADEASPAAQEGDSQRPPAPTPPRDFTPSEQVSEDAAVDFPIDI